MDLHEKGWIAQKIGWGFMLAVMLFTALGLFGEGPLSTKKATAGNVEIQYDHFYRYEKEMKILLKSNEHISNIAFPQEYLKHFRIVRMIPEPKDNQSVGTDVQYNFQGDQNKLTTIYLMPEDYGKISGVVKANNQGVLLNHFIYP